MNTIAGRKRTTFSLSEATLVAMTDIAARTDKSINDIAEEILTEGVQQYRAKLRRVVLLDDLPKDLVGVSLDHPLFDKGARGKGPFKLVTERVTTSPS